MTSINELESFMRQGLKSYPGAREAVELYEEQVKDQLAGLLETTDLTNFKQRRGPRGRGKAIFFGADRSMDGRYITANQNSAAKDGGSIELGLLWGSSKARDGVIMFCGFWQGGQLRNLELTKPTRPVRCEPVGRNLARLFVVLGDGFDLDSTGRTLLADLDRALGEIARASQGEDDIAAG